MLDEQSIDLIIAIYSAFSTFLFGFTCIKRKFLSIWVTGSICFSLGAAIYYFRFLNEIFRLVGNMFYLFTIIIFIFAIFYEYNFVFKKRENMENNSKFSKSLFLVFASFSIILIQGIMIILTIIVSVMLLRIYLKHKSITHISMFLTVIVGLFSIISTFLNDFGLEGTWELSYIGNIILITFLLTTALAAPIEDRIKESEQKFRNLFEGSPLMIVLVDKDGKIIDCNERVSFDTKHDRSEIIDMNIRELGDIIPYDHLYNTIEKFKKALKVGVTESVEFQIRKKNGDLFWVRVHASFIHIGEKTIMQVIMGDIEKEKQAEEIVKNEIEKLKELDRMRKDLLTRVSHELKTPLTSIYGVSQILVQQKNDLNIKNIANFIEILYRGSVRLKELVENLIDASRLESKKYELTKKRENITLIIENCINEMMYLAKIRNLNTFSDLVENVFLEVDKLRLEQAIINLLSNAIKNTPQGGDIFIRLSETEDFVDIEVKDTGVGLTNEEKMMLFKKFGKIERYGMDLDVDIEGAGLGLYISKEIAELHRGEILVESKGRNEGAKFIIRLLK